VPATSPSPKKNIDFLGIAAALTAKGLDLEPAALLAARVNRLAGLLASPTPATQVGEIIAHIPQALAELHDVIKADEVIN
jgi:NAD(P)H-hydrate repair Nnr-like enzyme with NAD(P)H-hydrate dehydratase domain